MPWYVVCGKELDWSLWFSFDREERSTLVGYNAQDAAEEWLRLNGENDLIYRTREAAEAELKRSMAIDQQQGRKDGYTQVKEITVEDVLQALCKLNRLTVDSHGSFAYAPKRAKLPPLAQEAFTNCHAFCRDTVLSPDLLAMYRVGILFREPTFCDTTFKFGGFAASHRYLIISAAKFLCLDNVEPKTDWGLCIRERRSVFKVIGKLQRGEFSQVALLQIPEKFRPDFTTAALSQQEEVFAAQAAEQFEKALSLPPLQQLQTRQWLDRLTYPLGINDNGQFFESWAYTSEVH